MIGKGGKKRSRIQACGPQRIGGNVQNHTHDIGDWQKPGDFAEYRLWVATPGDYRAELKTGDSAHNVAENVDIIIKDGDSGYQRVRAKWGTLSLQARLL